MEGQKGCPCFFEDFNSAVADGPLLTKNFLCRKCNRHAHDHDRHPPVLSGNEFHPLISPADFIYNDFI